MRRQFAAYYGESALRAALAAPAGNRSVDRFDALGSVVQCPPRLLQVLGRGDDEKRVCAALAAARPCVIVSIGSNNQWGFEEAVASEFPHCRVETFDCTVDAAVPAPLRSRVTFHPFCLGVRDNAQELSWPGIVRRLGLTGPPTALKADIEGFEWDVFDALARSGAESLLPFSLSIEVHLWTEVKEVRWQGRWRRPEETAGWMETLRTIGYVLVDRHDNPLCSYCSEITLARIAPPRNAAGAPARIPAALPAVLRDDLQTKIRIAEPPLAVVRIPNSLAERTPAHASSPDAPLEAPSSPRLARAGVTRRGRDAR